MLQTDHGIVHKRSQTLIDFACTYATKAHAGQLRKYTGEPYITHPIAVANIVAEVTTDCNMICAAFLHDTIEDCGVSRGDLITLGFGHPIADLVLELSDVSVPSDGNRATRKHIDLLHLADISDDAQTVKLADLIHNSESILAYGGDFAEVYMREKSALLEVLHRGNAGLLSWAYTIVHNYYKGA